MTATRRRAVSLDADRMMIGKSPDNDLPLPDDPTASHLDALLESCSAGGAPTWLLHGSWLNAVRGWHSQRVRHGDEIRDRPDPADFRDLNNATLAGRRPRTRRPR
jgi:hypothetical protein